MSTRTAITYARVSTAEQAGSGFGLEVQALAMAAALDMRSWSPAVAHLVDEGVSGSIAPQKRPQLAEALRMLAAGEADALIVAKLDRATRSVADLCELLDLSDKQGWDFIALDLGIDTSTPMGRAMAQISGVFAELERKLIAERTKAALAVAKSNGVRLGRKVAFPDSVRRRITFERAGGFTLQAIADRLNDDGVATAQGAANWSPGTVRNVLESVALDAEMAELAA